MNTYNNFVFKLSQLGYKENYILLKTGTIYNCKTCKALNSKDYKYTLPLKDGGKRNVQLKELYRKAFNEEYYIDNIISLKGEEWKVMYKHNSNYRISNYGRIKKCDCYNAIITQGSPNSLGYLQIQINRKKYYIHRLVAEYFLENPENKPQVHHKDGCRINNSANNLIYLTPEEHRQEHRKMAKRWDMWKWIKL